MVTDLKDQLRRLTENVPAGKNVHLTYAMRLSMLIGIEAIARWVVTNDGNDQISFHQLQKETQELIDSISTERQKYLDGQAD